MWEQVRILQPLEEQRGKKKNLMLLQKGWRCYEGKAIGESEAHIKTVDFPFTGWLFQWLTSCYNDEIHTPIFLSSHPSTSQGLILYSPSLLYSCLGFTCGKKKSTNSTCYSPTTAGFLPIMLSIPNHHHLHTLGPGLNVMQAGLKLESTG